MPSTTLRGATLGSACRSFRLNAQSDLKVEIPARGEIESHHFEELKIPSRSFAFVQLVHVHSESERCSLVISQITVAAAL